MPGTSVLLWPKSGLLRGTWNIGGWEILAVVGPEHLKTCARHIIFYETIPTLDKNWI